MNRTHEVRRYSQEQILCIVHDPRMRWHEVPGGQELVECLLAVPDQELMEIFAFRVEEQEAKLLANRDNPFYGNAAPEDSIPTAGSLQVTLPPPSSEPYYILMVSAQENQNLLITGAAGGGKTSFLRLVLLKALECGATIVLIERKQVDESIGRQAFQRPGLGVLPLDVEELRLCPLQPPMDMDPFKYAASLVVSFSSILSLIASTRVVMDCASFLLERRRPGSWPSFGDWTNEVGRRVSRRYSRESQYAEVAYMAFKHVLLDLGRILDARSSSMMEQIVTYPGLVVLGAQSLTDWSASIIAALLMHYSYHYRRLNEGARLRPVFFAFDDALRLAVEPEGMQGIHANPVAESARMGRAFGQFVILSTQNYARISTVFRGNLGLIVAAGPSTGEDCAALARDMGLSREQADAIALLHPGDIVVRKAGKLAVKARFPEVV